MQTVLRKTANHISARKKNPKNIDWTTPPLITFPDFWHAGLYKIVFSSEDHLKTNLFKTSYRITSHSPMWCHKGHCTFFQVSDKTVSQVFTPLRGKDCLFCVHLVFVPFQGNRTGTKLCVFAGGCKQRVKDAGFGIPVLWAIKSLSLHHCRRLGY